MSSSRLVFAVVAIVSLVGFTAANFVVIFVITHSEKLRKNPAFMLIRLLAINDALAACMPILNIVFVGLLALGVGPVPDSFCRYYGPLYFLWIVASPFGQMVIALNRFAAVFFWQRYAKLFTARTIKILWLALVWLPATVFSGFYVSAAFGRFISVPVYGMCNADQMPGSNNQMQAALMPVLAMPSIVLLAAYMAIWVRVRFGTTAASRATVAARSRGSLMMFAAFMFYVLTLMPAPVTMSLGWLDFTNLGNWPLWFMFIMTLSYGCNFIFYIALNKEFRGAFRAWWAQAVGKSATSSTVVTHGTILKAATGKKGATDKSKSNTVSTVKVIESGGAAGFSAEPRDGAPNSIMVAVIS